MSTGRAECGTWEKFPSTHWHTFISPAPACPIPPSPTVPRVSAQIPAATVFLARPRATPFYRPISAAVDGVGVATEPETHPAMSCSSLPKESLSQEINESVRWIVPARRRQHGPIPRLVFRTVHPYYVTAYPYARRESVSSNARGCPLTPSFRFSELHPNSLDGSPCHSELTPSIPSHTHVMWTLERHAQRPADHIQAPQTGHRQLAIRKSRVAE